jgi:pre-mRNA-splicing factor CWC26
MSSSSSKLDYLSKYFNSNGGGDYEEDDHDGDHRKSSSSGKKKKDKKESKKKTRKVIDQTVAAYDEDEYDNVDAVIKGRGRDGGDDDGDNIDFDEEDRPIVVADAGLVDVVVAADTILSSKRKQPSYLDKDDDDVVVRHPRGEWTTVDRSSSNSNQIDKAKNEEHGSETTAQAKRRQRYDSDESDNDNTNDPRATSHQMPRRRYDSDDDDGHSDDDRYRRGHQKTKRRHDSDESSGASERSKESSSRHQQQHRRRHDSDDESSDSNGSGDSRQKTRHDSDSDDESNSDTRNERQQKKSRQRYDSDDDSAPEHGNTKSSDKKRERMSSGHMAGLQDYKVFNKSERKIQATKQEEAQLMVDKYGMGETVYRDKLGKKQVGDAKKVVHLDADAQRRLNEGTVQQQAQRAAAEELAMLRDSSFARYQDDDRLDDIRKNEIREGDPMAQYASKQRQKKKSKHPTSSAPASYQADSVSTAKPVYKGPPPKPNRYGIKPGYRWDGIDRGNGFEDKLLAQKFSANLKKEEAYRFRSADM